MVPDAGEVLRELESIFKNARGAVPEDGFMSMKELLNAYEEEHGTRISSQTIHRQLHKANKAGVLEVERRLRYNIMDETYRPICYKLKLGGKDGDSTTG